MPHYNKIRGRVKLIKVSEETAAELSKLKRWKHETYDSVIRRLIESYKSRGITSF